MRMRIDWFVLLFPWPIFLFLRVICTNIYVVCIMIYLFFFRYPTYEPARAQPVQVRAGSCPGLRWSKWGPSCPAHHTHPTRAITLATPPQTSIEDSFEVGFQCIAASIAISSMILFLQIGKPRKRGGMTSSLARERATLLGLELPLLR